MMTYGRPELVDEAVYSFLKQDYPGEKHLIVYNDCPWVEHRIKHPEVSVFNLERRFNTLGEKLNSSLVECLKLEPDLVVPWPDDDIHLPGTLSLFAKYSGRPWVGFRGYWFSVKNENYRYKLGYNHALSAW